MLQVNNEAGIEAQINLTLDQNKIKTCHTCLIKNQIPCLNQENINQN